MDINIVSILIPMIIGFVAVVISVHGLIRSDMNHRFAEQDRNNDRRFSELKEDMNNNKREIKAEIGEIRIDMKELRNRLDMYIDSFAVRVIAGEKLQRKTAKR